MRQGRPILVVFVELLIGMAIGITTAIAQAPQSSAFMSPAVDRSIFREGEVQRVSADFQSWRVVCDVVERLNQRFCSLFGAGKDQDGRTVVRVVVTTSDDGQPAALLHLPVSVGVGSPVEITAVPAPAQSQPEEKAKETKSKAASKKDNKKSEQPQRLVVVSCDSKSCMTLWKLSSEQIRTLNAVGALHVRFSFMTVPAAGPGGKTSLVPVEAAINGVGFAEAVNASMAKDGVLR
jgi:invasion protein IalB